MNNKIIVTRHQGTVEWLQRRGIKAPVLPRAKRTDVENRVVYGVLPVMLAAYAKEVWIIEIPHLPFMAKGVELSADDLEKYGAKLVHYKVRRKLSWLPFCQFR